MNIIDKFKSLPIEVKASIVYTICSILTKCLSLITMPIFTRIMSTEEYGLSIVYYSTAAIVIIFTSLQLPYGSLSTAMIKFKNDREVYLSTLCAVSMVLTVIYLIFVFLFQHIIVKWLNLPIILLYVLGIETLFTTICAAWMGYQRFVYNYRSVLIVTILTSVISTIVSLVIVFHSNNKGIDKILSNAAIITIIGAILYYRIILKSKIGFKREHWRFAFSFNLPLIPYYLSQIIFIQSDRLMIDNYCGRSDTAIYGVAYSLGTALTFIVTSIHSSYIPWIYNNIETNNFKNNKQITSYLSIGIAFILLGLVGFTPEIITIMAGEKYIEAIKVVPPVAISILVLYYAGLFDCFLFYFEKKEYLMVSALISAIVNILLNSIFLPKYGFVAAAYTTLFSYIILAYLDYIFMIKVCKEKLIPRDIYEFKWLIYTFAFLFLISYFLVALYDFRKIRYLIGLFVFIVLIIKRKIIIIIIKKCEKGSE